MTMAVRAPLRLVPRAAGRRRTLRQRSGRSIKRDEIDTVLRNNETIEVYEQRDRI